MTAHQQQKRLRAKLGGASALVSQLLQHILRQHGAARTARHEFHSARARGAVSPHHRVEAVYA